MKAQELSYKELQELGRPSTYDYHHIVYIQFMTPPHSVTLSDFYRVTHGFVFDDDFDRSQCPASFHRIGRGKQYHESDGFKRSTYLKEWRAFLVCKDPKDIVNITWGD